MTDGHRHEVRWAQSDLHAQLQLVREQSHRSGRAPEIEVLVHVVTVTEDRAAVLADLSEQLQGPSPEVLASTPFVLVGTSAEITDQLVRQSELLGITRYVIREPAIEILQARPASTEMTGSRWRCETSAPQGAVCFEGLVSGGPRQRRVDTERPVHRRARKDPLQPQA